MAVRRQVNRLPKDVVFPRDVIINYSRMGVPLVSQGRLLEGTPVTMLPKHALDYLKSAYGFVPGEAPPSAPKPAPSPTPARVQMPRLRARGIERQPPPERAAPPEKFAVNRAPRMKVPPKQTVFRVYYARPVWMMGTAQDQFNIITLKKRFPNAKILMARKNQHKDRMKQDPFVLKPKTKMAKFFKNVEQADLVVAAESERSSLSAGVFAEVRKAQKSGIDARVIRGTRLNSISSTQVIPKSDTRNQRTTWAKVKLR